MTEEDNPVAATVFSQRENTVAATGLSSSVTVALAIVTDGERVLLTRRQPGEHLEGLLEFPGGKVNPEEPADEAARRELLEETGLELPRSAFRPLTFVHWNYGPRSESGPDRRVLLVAFVARVASAGGPAISSRRGAKWVPLADLPAVAMPPANRRVIELLGGLLF